MEIVLLVIEYSELSYCVNEYSVEWFSDFKFPVSYFPQIRTSISVSTSNSQTRHYTKLKITRA